MARVLVVEDEAAILKSLQRFLTGAGHQVLTAGGGREAQKVLAEHEVDVIVTDIVMPGVDGVELLAAVHENDPSVEVILVTGKPDLETAIRAVQEGAFDYLAKPISGHDICRAVGKAAESKLLKDKNRELWEANEKYRERLEDLVQERTGRLVQVNSELQREIAERKRAEEESRRMEAQVRHTQKLESLGVLAGGIAHDFNNLMAVVLLQAELVEEMLPPGSPARAHLAEIAAAAQQSAELSREMLAYAGKGKKLVETVNLSRLVEETSHLVEASISKKAALAYRLAPELPAVEADPTQISQIVLNLITNASEALGDGGGQIAVATSVAIYGREELLDAVLGEDLAPGRFAYLEVADDGGGMDATTVARVFDPFFTTKLSGRGLGLATVLGIVRSHGGAIEVESAPKRGTRIRVLFPASASPSAAAAETGTDELGGTVLLVDDEKWVLKAVKNALEKIGFDVLTANDGREGVETFRRHAEEIVLVLLDQTMPHLSGDETLDEIRAIRSDVPAILSSGYSGRELAARSEGKGFDGILQKPYQLKTLRSTVRGVLPGGS